MYTAEQREKSVYIKALIWIFCLSYQNEIYSFFIIILLFCLHFVSKLLKKFYVSYLSERLSVSPSGYFYRLFHIVCSFFLFDFWFKVYLSVFHSSVNVLFNAWIFAVLPKLSNNSILIPFRTKLTRDIKWIFKQKNLYMTGNKHICHLKVMNRNNKPSETLN